MIVKCKTLIDWAEELVGAANFLETSEGGQIVSL